MRILERCASSRAMPETKAQIDALREAFSADTSKPFELKPNFPYRSPSPNMQPSPSFDIKYQHDVLSRPNSNGQIAQVAYHHQPLTPPMSGEHDDPNQPLSATSMPIMPTIEHQTIPLTSNSIDSDPIAWNPSRIFEYDLEKHKVKSSTNKSNSQWNTAFGTSGLDSTRTVPMPQPSPPLYTSSAIGSHELPPLHDAMQRQTQQQYSVQSSIAPIPAIPAIPAIPEAPAVMSQPSYTSPSPSFVTSSMWRETVANTYDPGGHKRRWEVETNFLVDLTQPKGLKWAGLGVTIFTSNCKAACSFRREPSAPPLASVPPREDLQCLLSPCPSSDESKPEKRRSKIATPRLPQITIVWLVDLG